MASVSPSLVSLAPGDLFQPLQQLVPRAQIQAIRQKVFDSLIRVNARREVRCRGDDPFGDVPLDTEHADHSVHIVERDEVARPVRLDLIEIAH